MKRQPQLQKTNAWVRRMLGMRLVLACLPVLAADSGTPDPVQLLQHSDLARGGGLSGLVWTVRVHNTGADDGHQDMTLRVKAAGSSSVAETLEPLRSKGSKLLQVGRAMWLTKPGLKKPVPISPRQRLTGLAAIGDIAATNYAQDYVAAFLREDDLANEPCYVLELKAADRQATYDKVLYWISRSRGLAVRAQFLSVSGKPLKVAEFTYHNTLRHNGRSVPFVSSMTIADALTSARTQLDYSDIRERSIPESEFDVGHLD